MIKKIAIVLLPFFLSINLAAQTVSLKKGGMVVRKSVKLKAGNYNIDAIEGQPVIVVEGSNIVVDGNKLVLKGSTGKTRPDEFMGIAIMIRNGKNITLKNFFVKGYKIAVMAMDVENLKIENCDFSYNYRQHL